jgi:hypothetical protein
MQGTLGTARFGFGHLKVVAIGLGILASAAVATAGVFAVTNSPADSNRSPITQTPTASELGSYTFQEQNTVLPTSGAPSYRLTDAEWKRFFEENAVSGYPGREQVHQRRGIGFTVN